MSWFALQCERAGEGLLPTVERKVVFFYLLGEHFLICLMLGHQELVCYLSEQILLYTCWESRS